MRFTSHRKTVSWSRDALILADSISRAQAFPPPAQSLSFSAIRQPSDWPALYAVVLNFPIHPLPACHACTTPFLALPVIPSALVRATLSTLATSEEIWEALIVNLNQGAFRRDIQRMWEA